MSNSAENSTSEAVGLQPRQKVISALVLLGEAGAFAGLMVLLVSGRLTAAMELLQRRRRRPLATRRTPCAMRRRRGRRHSPDAELGDPA